MPIPLFKHNRDAYEAAAELLAESGKAAVIHPTGTGKSFIGFRLCEEYADKRICWLSPSEYIFRTQLENLRNAAGVCAPENLKFYTYAKLMRMSSEEMETIRPDFIVLDEFHRCGAKMWGVGVQRMLAMYPKARILGLSATNIRYLDNRRDMADELFNGCIASEINLGEAIVRGILDPPKYVLSLYSCQNQLEKYRSRVHQAKSREVREKGEMYIEALRRALEKTEGLETVFERHITDRSGKYIVFCSSAGHMEEMMKKVPEWFGRIDRKPHLYKVYSEEPGAEKEFDAFKADGSSHLKLLFCIDMLNEGIHVPDVCGVILLRPTGSPILYKQQIGRAFSVGKRKDAVIFDIVLNIESLSSIGLVEEEMQLATTYYRSLGLDKEIVRENFRVVDEVHDCMELFSRLNDTLGASWDLMYEQAQHYFRETGDLNVPKRYVTQSGYSLGSWLDTQRRVRSGKAVGSLSAEQIRRLDLLGMRWESASDLSWKRCFAAAKKFYEQKGNLRVSRLYVTKDGLKLGAWIANLRTYRKNGIRSSYLSEDRIRSLDAIGMQWGVADYTFEQNFAAASAYHRAHGNLDVPAHYVSPDGVRLGSWIANLRSRRRSGTLGLTEEQIRRLDELGMLWGGKYQSDWDRSFEEARQYAEECGSLDVPTKYRTSSGHLLGRWVQRQRKLWEIGQLKKERRQKLDSIGMIWVKEKRCSA